jgi:hypothetical protein
MNEGTNTSQLTISHGADISIVEIRLEIDKIEPCFVVV